MKKVLVLLLSSILVSGCFICRKSEPKKKEPKAPAPKIHVIKRHSIPEAANFAFDSRDIRPDRNKMTELEQDILANPEAVILVEGHTDSVGTEEYNRDLSLQRAHSVARALEERGYPNEIRIYGAGTSAPLASNDTEAGREQNRRVDVILIREED